MAETSRARAVGVVALLGAAVLGTALPTWIHASTPTPTGNTAVVVAGTSAAPGAASVGLVIIAAALVLGLAGRLVRIVTLVGVIAASLIGAATVAAFLAAPEPVAATAAAELTSVRAITTPVSLTWWPYLSLAALTLSALIAGFLLTRLGAWEQVGRRYQRPTEAAPSRGAPPADPSTRARRQAMDDWDALTRGEDPS